MIEIKIFSLFTLIFTASFYLKAKHLLKGVNPKYFGNINEPFNKIFRQLTNFN